MLPAPASSLCIEEKFDREQDPSSAGAESLGMMAWGRAVHKEAGDPAKGFTKLLVFPPI